MSGSHVAVGQRLTGTVVLVPRPGTIGVFVDLGLPDTGFVDVLRLPHDPDRWPRVGTVSTFEVVWITDRRQIRLAPLDPAYRGPVDLGAVADRADPAQ
ncbi:hypothetical protein ACIRG5_12960 [Lentzea sp. NPDC102401]|uniref:hypothetical protein n=1 Tax=Lentzea sp. NPDC102401 TaxID=3364128 RepID=UPI003821DFCC